MMKMHTLEETDILFYLTNMVLPHIHRHICAAHAEGRVTVIYWKRAGYDFQSRLPEGVLEIPVEAAFFSRHSAGRLISFFIFALKSWFLLRKATLARIIYVNYLDVLWIASLAFRKSPGRMIYGVADLSSAQIGGQPLINAAVRRFEQRLMKDIACLILTSPHFWSEYYAKIYTGPWHLIENLPEAGPWKDFQRKPKDGICVIGYIGWLRERRPIECLLAAVRQLRTKGHDVRIFFAGFGPEEAEVKALAAGRAEVTFWGPYDYAKDIASLYGRVDVVFAVYDADSSNTRILMPHRFYEAVICGLPIMAARKTKLAERVASLDTGYVVDHLSVDQMKAALQSHIAFDDEAKRINAALQSIDKSAYVYDQYASVLSGIFSLRVPPEASTKE